MPCLTMHCKDCSVEQVVHPAFSFFLQFLTKRFCILAVGEFAKMRQDIESLSVTDRVAF